MRRKTGSRSSSEHPGARSGLWFRHPGLLPILTVSLLAILAVEVPAATAESGTPMRLYTRGYGGDFVLTDHNARTFALADQRGKVVLIYFGYTSCADVCPTTLVDVAAAMRQLGPSADRVQPVLISVDPKRDSLETLRTYLAYFHPSLLGLTGTPEEIAAVTRLYRAPAYERKPGEYGFYVVDHSSHIYVVDPDGKLGYLIPYGTAPEQIAKVVRDLLGEEVRTAFRHPCDPPHQSFP